MKKSSSKKESHSGFLEHILKTVSARNAELDKRKEEIRRGQKAA